MNIGNNNFSKSIIFRGNEKKYIAAGMSKINRRDVPKVEHLLSKNNNILIRIARAIKSFMI